MVETENTKIRLATDQHTSHLSYTPEDTDKRREPRPNRTTYEGATTVWGM